jgi:eukaryotic-like serine/threonine-protein kinase
MTVTRRWIVLHLADKIASMLQAGAVLRKRYQIERPIGQGGMGSVYLAEDLRLEGRKCAVKAVRIDPTLEPQVIAELQRQFSQEASVLARLDHPNLPKVSDYFAEDGTDYLVMDYVSGSNLKELMDEARRGDRFLTEVEVLGWARQLCDALEYMHNQNPPVLHRDIKPSNIRLAPSGLIKLVDFGLVKLMTTDGSQTITILQGRGTAAYTPLEQYGEDDSHTDLRTDIYAFGATLYHLLTNIQPAEARQRFLRQDALRPPSVVNTSVSAPVQQAILAAISLHPDDRPTTIAEFRDMLFAEAPVAPSPAQRPQVELTNPNALMLENRMWFAVAGAATLLALIVTLVR